MIVLKTRDDIMRMRAAGQMVAQVLAFWKVRSDRG